MVVLMYSSFLFFPPAAQPIYLEPQLQPFCLAQRHQLGPVQCQR